MTGNRSRWALMKVLISGRSPNRSVKIKPLYQRKFEIILSVSVADNSTPVTKSRSATIMGMYAISVEDHGLALAIIVSTLYVPKRVLISYPKHARGYFIPRMSATDVVSAMVANSKDIFTKPRLRRKPMKKLSAKAAKDLPYHMRNLGALTISCRP